jgi:hypothetical protein
LAHANSFPTAATAHPGGKMPCLHAGQ